MTTTQFLANLDTAHLGAQAQTFTTSNTLAANIAENIDIPIDGTTGQPAGVVLFGIPTGVDFYAKSLSLQRAANRVTNGTFSSDTGWTKGAGWTIAAGVATATGAISTAISQTASSTTPLVQGRSYLVTFTITRSAGSIAASLGGGTAGTSRSSSGTFSEVIKAGATQVIAFTGTGFTGTIDDITVNECAQLPADITNGEAPILNPVGIVLNGDSVVSIVSTGTPTVTCQFFK